MRAVRADVGRLATLLWLAASGALVVVLAFQAGGFFPGAVAVAAGALLGAAGVRVALAARPLEGLGRSCVLGATALALLAVWTLSSAAWSDAPARALVEYDRVLLYLLAFVVFGSIGRSAARLRWMVRGIAAGTVLVSLAALATRVAPDIWTVAPSIVPDRLSYPLTYWNALGLMAASGLVMAFALTTDDMEPAAWRVAAAAAMPVLAATLLLTFSRASIVAGALGLLAVLIAGRPRALVGGLLVAVPAVGVAVTAAYRADLLASGHPESAAAAAQGHDVALVIGICVLAAAIGRWVLLGLDRRITGLMARRTAWRPVVTGGVLAALLVIVLCVGVVLGVPGTVQGQYERFVEAGTLSTAGSARGRLVEPGNNGRLDQWRVALDGFAEEPLHGQGAGTYPLLWDRGRPEIYEVEDAHSLYVEILAELGVVGLLLVAAVILLILGGFAARARGRDRMAGAALTGAGLAWAVHAGVDWDWEMPATTLWFFAAGGLALSAPSAPTDATRSARSTSRGTRVWVGLALIVLAIIPVQIWRSERALREGVRAFARGDCGAAIGRALDASAALVVRPEPYVVLGYCNARLGQHALAVRALRNAVRHDPGNWETHYGLALVRAAAGQDPRPAIRVARRLNPQGALPFDAARRFDTDDPRAWRSRALSAALPE